MRAIIIRIVFLIPTKLGMADTSEFHLSHCARSVAFIFVKHLSLSRASLFNIIFASFAPISIIILVLDLSTINY